MVNRKEGESIIYVITHWLYDEPEHYIGSCWRYTSDGRCGLQRRMINHKNGKRKCSCYHFFASDFPVSWRILKITDVITMDERLELEQKWMKKIECINTNEAKVVDKKKAKRE